MLQVWLWLENALIYVESKFSQMKDVLIALYNLLTESPTVWAVTLLIISELLYSSASGYPLIWFPIYVITYNIGVLIAKLAFRILGDTTETLPIKQVLWSICVYYITYVYLLLIGPYLHS